MGIYITDGGGGAEGEMALEIYFWGGGEGAEGEIGLAIYFMGQRGEWP